MPPVRPVGKTGHTGLLIFEQAETGQTGPVHWSDRSRQISYAILQFASDLLRGFTRSFEAFCVGLAFP